MTKTAIIFIAGIVIGGGGLYLYQNQSQAVLSTREAGTKAINFINQTIEEDVTASLMNISEESGVYKIHLQIGDREYDSYMTKNGRLLFSSAFVLEEQKAAGQKVSLINDSLVNLANCLAEKGAKFYGAFWCGHCQNQKEMFGEAEKYLPYVECSTEDGKGQLDVCKEKNIVSYPTWEFSDGSREAGELSLEKLSEKTGCQLP